MIKYQRTKMILIKIFGLWIVLVSKIDCMVINNFEPEVCDRRPLGTKTDPLYPNNQFYLEIDDIKESQYVPGRQYTVRLKARGEKTFIAFSISLKEDTAYNKFNPRKPRILDAGRLEPISRNAVLSATCKNTIIQSDILPKTSVEARWTAPGKGNKCVSIFTVVLEKPDIWYNFEGPLSTRVCEDPRKDDDMPPLELDSCDVCEDARYQLTFEGLWSNNTHIKTFPNSTELARFSDVVGASHLPNTTLYKQSAEASLGLKMLAEQGNTTQFEIEAQNKLPNVRTVIKATRPMKTYGSTVTSFRATREHHRLSIAAGILPSPDWFVGVSNLELCDSDSKWAKKIRLNLYPLDAGTDKGLDFESPNEETSPPLTISQAEIRNLPKSEIPPFARLLVTLVRTYTVPACTTEQTSTEGTEEENRSYEPDPTDSGGEGDNNGGDGSEDNKDPDQSPSVEGGTTPSDTETTVEPDTTHNCPMTQWTEWQECQSPCIDGDVRGLQTRFRKHIGNVIDQYCLDHYPDLETQECEVATCETEEQNEEDYGN